MSMSERQHRVLEFVFRQGGYWDGARDDRDAFYQCVERGWLDADGDGFCLTHEGKRALGVPQSVRLSAECQVRQDQRSEPKA